MTSYYLRPFTMIKANRELITMSVYIKSTSGVSTIACKSKLWYSASLTVDVTPNQDCDVIVTHEMDCWGYGGNKWERTLACSASGLSKVMERTLISHGHNNQYGYAKGIAIFTGLKAGTTYRFQSTDKSGRTGGFTNGLIMAAML